MNPPHIAIKRPIEVENIEKYEKILDKLAKSAKTFKIDIQGYSFFADKTFFLKVIKSKELMILHNNLLSMLKQQGIAPDNLEGDNQIFHITLANNDISTKFVEILKKNYLPKKPLYNFPLKELAILRYTSTHWVIHKIVSIKQMTPQK